MVPAGRDIDSWGILLFARRGTELLVLKRPLGFCLPVLSIPRQERIAENLNAEARRLWNLEAVCVAPLSVSLPQRRPEEVRYHVMEVLQPAELSRIAPQTMDVSALAPNTFSDERDYRAVRRAMNLDANETPQEMAGLFSEFGKFEEIAAWVTTQLSFFDRTWTGEFRQLHASAFFALIRFQTKDGAVWFKATGEPNQKELSITRQLGVLFPKWVPEILAVRSDWNAWLTNEARGMTLDPRPNIKEWCEAARALGELQVASAAHTSELLGCGTHDARTAKLSAYVSPFFREIERLMALQTKPEPRRLEPTEVRSLRVRITNALGELEASAIPDALNHFDLNPGNIVVNAGECRFLDWAEAAVGHPFLSFEYLRQHFLRTFGDQPGAATALNDSYARSWRCLLPETTIERALGLVPLIAPFAFAVTILPWNTECRTNEPTSAALLRSLARRMHQEAEEWTRAAYEPRRSRPCH